VVRVAGTDTVAVAGARVVLHRVTVRNPGPVDSASSDARGSFHFSLIPDTGAVYLVSARWAGIQYFGTPVALRPGSSPGIVTLVVADTSSQAPVQLAARHLIVSPVDADGMRDVVDLMVLENRGSITRVGSDSLHATWRILLPHFAVNIHGGNSGFSLESLVLSGDAIALFAAIPPGSHDIEIDYQIPPNSRRFEVPVGEDVPASNIISEDRAMVVQGPYIRSDTVIERKAYVRWQGRMVAGEPVVLQFGYRGVPKWLLPAMIAMMALALVGITARGMRAG
jgi:hypothetical protein